MIQPANLVKIPALLNQVSGTFLTDLYLQQLGNLGACFLRNFHTRNLLNIEAPSDLLTAGRPFIPTLNNNDFVYRWDLNLVE
jgi:hypothetical protein